MDAFPALGQNLVAKFGAREKSSGFVAPRSAPVLLVASAGGHLEELLHFSARFIKTGHTVEWVTPTTAQSAALLRGHTVHSVPYIGPRDLKLAAQQLIAANRLLSISRYSAVISTGAAIAIPYLAAARLHRIPAHYIESAARSLEPSLTGKLATRIPGVRLYTQYDNWEQRRWVFQGSVFDGFEVSSEPEKEKNCNRVVVTLGTMQKYGFHRAVEAIQRVLAQLPRAPESILWQTGCTDVSGLGIQGRELVPSDELSNAIAEADLVIAHAGVGSALTALSLGKSPVLIPRQAEFGEHIDDHQLMIAQFLQRRGLASMASPEQLSLETISSAMSRRVVRSEGEVPFSLST